MDRIGIMQPYIFPYIGFFQLISAVNLFVFYNDVSFIKKGWIHRNRILLNGKDFLFTIPCVNASQNKLICDTEIAFDQKEAGKLLATIVQAYRKAPHFGVVYALIEKVLAKEYQRIDKLAQESITEVCQYLNVPTKFTESCNRYQNQELKREDRLIDICLKESVTHYINPIGGAEIYTKEYFNQQGVKLQFLKPNPVHYTQFKNDFVPWLSIIDVMMFNDRDRICEYLQDYQLL